jgi:ubiquinone/menaquinone biosynthesis C-methylase UbiE
MYEEKTAYEEDLYSKFAEIHPEGSPLRLGWAGQQQQEERFRILSHLVVDQEASVLDVGSGYGDFYTFIKNYFNFQGEYQGIDQNKSFVTYAAQQHPDTTFIHSSFEDFISEKNFDYVVGSGLFAVDSPLWLQHFHEIIEKMFVLSNKGIAFNLLSDATNQRHQGFKYATIQEVLEITQELTTTFDMYHNYHPENSDMTFCLFK